MNLLLPGTFYDVALRDVGRFIGAIALTRPAVTFDAGRDRA
ncbi:MAG: hypothetical protein R2698_14860 [Microthrixaceae bacterium]